jgi:hypothetical protein
MIQPGRLSAPGEGAVRARVEAVFEAADRLSPPELWMSAMPLRDERLRRELITDLEQVVASHGRRPLLDDARGRVRDELMERSVSRWTAESGAVGHQTVGRSEDLVRILAAIEDAVAVAVAEDLLDPIDAASLADPGRIVLGLPPLLADPIRPDERPDALEVTLGEPTGGGPADDGHADGVPAGGDTAGDHAADDDAPDDDAPDDDALIDAELARSSRQARRAAVFVIVAAIAVPAGLSLGGVVGNLPLLAIILAASLLLAWLFG